MKNVEKIADNLKPLLRELSTLRYDQNNARSHPEESIDALTKSLAAFGQIKPIVVRKNIVVAGNGTLAAAQVLGWKRIAAVEFVGSEEQAKAFAIADNRTAELSLWNEAQLAETLEALKHSEADISALGFNDRELNLLLRQAEKALPEAQEEDKQKPSEFKEYNESVEEEVDHHTCPNCGHKFPRT